MKLIFYECCSSTLIHQYCNIVNDENADNGDDDYHHDYQDNDDDDDDDDRRQSQ